MKHILPTDTINKVLNFLATKPYSEVSALITEIQSSAKQHSADEVAHEALGEALNEEVSG